MFSYQQFADGAHRFRQDVLRQDSEENDRQYETARSENELAVINLSRNSEAGSLAHILTYLPSLLVGIRKQAIIGYDECRKISTFFTYYKLIAQECQLAFTQLDLLYNDTRIDYNFSTGGLIYTITPDESIRKKLPAIRAKVPIANDPAKVRTIIHEAFVALVALNPLRSLIPSFSYVYSYWQCGNLIDVESTLSGLCITAGSRPVMIYEDNPGAEPLSVKLERDKSSLNLSSTLDYLLQIMGALEMAHSYADYTHYDLHSGNILVQRLDRYIDIAYGDYELSTRERIIIIDNGIAYCNYELPNSLAILRRRKSVEFANSESVELFNTSSDDMDRLQGSRLRVYGSVQNRMLGVRYDRSYPLGDIFRIFFDIFTSCSSEVQRGLLPLMGVFFSDVDLARRLLFRDRDHASSMVNTFALPPFRDDLFEYSYREFAREILDRYPLKRVHRRSVILHVPTPRLEDLFDWKTMNKNFLPTIYDVGIVSLLDSEEAKAMRGRTKKRREWLFNDLRAMEVELINVIEKTSWRDIELKRHSVASILDDEFYAKFVSNMKRCVNHVQWIRSIYSNVRVLYMALSLELEGELALQLIADTLEVQRDDLVTLAAYCRRAGLPRRSIEACKKMLEIAGRVQDIVSDFLSAPHRISEDNIYIKWYRACLPSIRIHLEFCVQWGNIDASFGELSLPDVDSI